MRYPQFGRRRRVRSCDLFAGALLLSSQALSGCEGSIGLPKGTLEPESPPGVAADAGSAGGPGVGAPDAGPQASPCESTPRPPRRVALRSELQFANGLRDLLGPDVLAGATGVPSAEGRTLDLDYVNQMSPKSLATRYGFVLAAGDRAASAVKTVAPCNASQTPAACAESVAAALVEHAFRRPPEPEEIADLVNVYTAGAATSHEEGIKWMVEAIAFAPSAMYTRELGTSS